MFDSILIANRGEIACRIMATARRMGIRCIAIHSEVDRDAPHVVMADEAVCVGPPAASDSYLNMKRVIDAAKRTGAGAVHPGYGFLSENAAFVRRLRRAGIPFIGPKPRAISMMGDKLESKRLALKAGVNIIPGSDGPIAGEKAALAAARGIGYPVMLKAAAGGGGKGMRIVEDAAALRESLGAVRRESAASFGDDRVFLERYITRPRHVEIQVLADQFGNIVHLGERECSIQRRHQKVIEEAPSPALDEDTRLAMGRQAIALARAVDYVSAGTVEFVVDQDGAFHFLEMNTRLQVEHPVTEMVTGLDLVEWMIRIAAGEKLAFGQDDIRLDGWAVEARIYAEDPLRGFLPSIGRLVRFKPPETSPQVRVDLGVCEGGEISVHYDPMIAKVIGYGADRNAAIGHLGGALDEFVVEGPSTNIGFLAAVTGHPRFRSGKLSTDFIAEVYPGGFHPAQLPHDDPHMLSAVAAAVHLSRQSRAQRISGQVRGFAHQLPDVWVALHDGLQHEVRVVAVEGGWQATVDGAPFVIQSNWRIGDSLMRATINGVSLALRIVPYGAAYRYIHGGSETRIVVLSRRAASLAARMTKKPPRTADKTVVSPMPGLLQSVAVVVGQEVRRGESLAVIEAMKMENIVRAPGDGIIAAVHAAPGDSLIVDQPILDFE